MRSGPSTGLWFMLAFVATIGCVDSSGSAGAVLGGVEDASATTDAAENDAPPPENPPTSAPADPSDGASAINPGEPAASDQDILGELTTFLNNKRLEFGDSSGNGRDAFLTKTSELTLCATGDFRLDETTIFSGSTGGVFSDFDSADTFFGQWSVQIESGQPFIELRFDSVQPGEPDSRRLAVASGANGEVFIDGAFASVSDALAACGAETPAEPVADDPIAAITAAFSNVTLLFGDGPEGAPFPTAQIGRELTLCATGDFFLVETSQLNGDTRRSFGAWQVLAEGADFVLALTVTQSTSPITGKQPRFTITSDEAGNAFLNGAVVSAFDGVAACQELAQNGPPLP